MTASTLLRPPQEPRDAETRRTLRHFAEWLTSPDDDVRRRTLEIVLKTMIPSVQRSIVAELLGVLHRGHAPSCQRAVEALVAVGSPAVAALVHGLRQGGDAAWLVRLAGALADITPAVPDHERMKLFLELDVVLVLTPHDAVAKAVIRAMAPLAVGKAQRGAAGPAGGK